MRLLTEIGDFSLQKWEQARRDRILAETQREAEACDCWRFSGPLCAKCKLIQAQKAFDGLR